MHVSIIRALKSAFRRIIYHVRGISLRFSLLIEMGIDRNLVVTGNVIDRGASTELYFLDTRRRMPAYRAKNARHRNRVPNVVHFVYSEGFKRLT